MARVMEHRQALTLRKQGKSYSQIRKEIGVAKSTLSDWLKKYPLSKEQISLLRNDNEERIERYRNTMRNKLEKRLLEKYNKQGKKWLPLSDRELFIAGLYLYWGEGNKADRHAVKINNTDPSVVKFALLWLTKSLGFSKTQVHVQVHLYSDMDIEKELNFWSEQLKLGRNQFTKPYIKKSKKTDLDQKSFGHGTCGLIVHNTGVKEDILMAINALADFYAV